MHMYLGLNSRKPKVHFNCEFLINFGSKALTPSNYSVDISSNIAHFYNSVSMYIFSK